MHSTLNYNVFSTTSSPTEEEKKQHEILKAYRDEQKAVDDEHFAITFIPDSSEACRVRATLIQEQRKIRSSV